MTPLQQIESAARHCSHRREALKSLVKAINDSVERIYRERGPELKRLVLSAAQAQAELKLLVAEHPGEFEKPRTQVFHNIKVGYRKGIGGIAWEDDDDVIRLIKKHFPELEDVLIHTEETPIKKALQELPAVDLKKLGVTVEETGDVVVVKPVDTAVDKTIKALLKSASKELEQEAA